jgi:hypothetical protein
MNHSIEDAQDFDILEPITQLLDLYRNSKGRTSPQDLARKIIRLVREHDKIKHGRDVSRGYAEKAAERQARVQRFSQAYSNGKSHKVQLVEGIGDEVDHILHLDDGESPE